MGCRFVTLLATLAMIIGLAAGARAGETGNGPLGLPPYVGLPTADSAVVNLVAGEGGHLWQVRCRPEGAAQGPEARSAEVRLEAAGSADLQLSGLQPGRRYVYEVLTRTAPERPQAVAATGVFSTRRTRPEPFAFAVFSDAHITPAAPERRPVLAAVAETIAARKPEFVLALGDNIQALTQSHGGPFAKAEYAFLDYTFYRQALGRLPATTAVFTVIGNWEGENGWHPEEARGWARQARQELIPNPGATTYPEGGGPAEDYYAFTWGEVLVVVLNVTGYTPNDHALGSAIGRADDWTLGAQQCAWLESCLKGSTAPYKLLFIHHTVGGRAGDELNSRYGRGGGRAAHVGEQQKIHELMRATGVQALFYGHDHVFTVQETDGIAYVCAGSAGAPWKFGQAETGYAWSIPDSGFVWVRAEKERLMVSYVRPDGAAPEGRELHAFEIARTPKK